MGGVEEAGPQDKGFIRIKAKISQGKKFIVIEGGVIVFIFFRDELDAIILFVIGFVTLDL